MLYDPKTNPVIKALYDAADIVEQRGLAKYTKQDRRGRVCLHGAISLAIGEAHDETGSLHLEIAFAVRRYLRKEYGFEEATILWDCAAWNDADERTKDEVVAALRETASMLVVGG